MVDVETDLAIAKECFSKGLYKVRSAKEWMSGGVRSYRAALDAAREALRAAETATAALERVRKVLWAVAEGEGKSRAKDADRMG